LKQIATFIVVFSGVSLASAQQTGTVTLSGVVVDSVGNAIPKASIWLFSARDTFFASSTEEGQFVFNQLKVRDLRLRINHLSFVSRELHVVIPKDSTSLDLGKLTLNPKVIELEELSVGKRPEVFVDGDTIHFETSHITDSLETGAFLKELMARLPGMEVSPGGGLTYMGEPITRARINGIDFFGGDVPLALNNLPADLINRLQLIDDYGEQAALTGIRTGLATKVLNLLVDDDQNRGIFTYGRNSYGLRNRYLARLGINYFNKHRQLSIGAGQNNLNIPPVQRTVTSRTVGEGASEGVAAGLNKLGALDMIYSDRWFGKVDVPLEYQFEGADNHLLIESVQQQQFGGDRFLHTRQTRTQYADRTSHYIASGNKSFRFTSKSGKTSVTFKPQLRLTHATALSSDTAVQQLMEQGLLSSEQTTVSTENNSALNREQGGNLTVNRLLNSKGRMLTFTSAYHRSEVRTDEEQIDEFSLPTDENGSPNESLHLRTRRESRRDHISMETQLTERISDTHLLHVSLSYNLNNSDGLRVVRDGSADGIRIDSLSNETAFRFGQTQALVGIQKNAGKTWRYQVNFRWVQLNQSGEYGPGASAHGNQQDHRSHRSDGYFTPNISLYHTSSGSRKSLSYRWTVQQPTLDQLNPVADRADARIIRIGNPDLTAGITHNIGASWQNMSLTNSLRLGLSGQYVQNRISPDIRLVRDDSGILRQELHYQNVRGGHQVSGNYYYDRSIVLRKGVKDRVYFRGDVAIRQDRFLESGLVRQAVESTFNQRVTISISRKQFSSDFGMDYRLNQSSRDQALGLHPLHEWNFQAKISTPSQSLFRMSVEVSHMLRNGYTGPGEVSSPTLINASLSRRFFRNGLTVAVEAVDLLDQQSAISRRISHNSISDVSHNSLGRQVYVSVAWNYGKFGRNMPMGMVF